MIEILRKKVFEVRLRMTLSVIASLTPMSANEQSQTPALRAPQGDGNLLNAHL